VLDHRLLVLIELLLQNVDGGDPNIWIVRLQERVFQLTQRASHWFDQ
jgi:hypothetical protein